MPPTLANGKICYLEIPATDIARSAEFYKGVFGWNIRKRGERILGTRALARLKARPPRLHHGGQRGRDP